MDKNGNTQKHSLNETQLLLDACPSFILVFNKNLRYIMGMADSICAHFGLALPPETSGPPFWEALKNASSAPWIISAGDNCRKIADQTEALINYNEQIELSDKRRLYVNINILPAFDESANMGVIFFMHDITALLLTKERAETAARAKSNFLTSISHEIRTPLNAVRGMSNLLNATQLTETQKDYVKNILTASDALLQIINDILDFSKIDSENMELMAHSYDTAEIIKDVINVTNMRALEKGLSFITDVDPALPAALIGDELRIKQILSNVLGNAAKYTKHGSVTLSADYEKSSDFVTLIFKVKDTGIGIKKEDLGNIFNAFYQLGENKQYDKRGTGLGLAICKKLLDSMDGEILVESEYGAGSTFTLKIPQKVSSLEPIVQINDPGKKRVLLLGGPTEVEAVGKMLGKLFLNYDCITDNALFLEAISKNTYTHIIYWYDLGDTLIRENIGKLTNVAILTIKDLRKVAIQDTLAHVEALFEPVFITNIGKFLNMNPSAAEKPAQEESLGGVKTHDVKALLVDDNEINLMVAEELLKHYNIEVASADSGFKAIELSGRYNYDIIFMDHMMPEMDGVETTARIRKLNRWCAGVPVIALTANDIAGAKEFLTDSLMDDYLSKPIDIKKLNGVLNKWLPKDKIDFTAKDDILPAKEPQQVLNSFLSRVEASCGIDVKYSLNMLGGNEDAYLSLLNIFVGKARTGKQDLLRMRQEKDWDNFRITVHGYKSAFHNIGAKTISEEARKLEVAVIQENFDYIYINFFDFIRNMEKLEQDLSSLLEENKTREAKTPASCQEKSVLRENLLKVSECIDQLERDNAIKQMHSIMRFTYGEATDEKLEKIKTAIESFDYDSAAQDITQLPQPA